MKYFITSKLSENIAVTPEGYLICVGVPVARTGDMQYAKDEVPDQVEPDSNGTVTITRSENEVFRPETIASFEGKPITITHPLDFVSPSNWSNLAKGTMKNVRRGTGDQKDDLIADLLITDAMAIALVKNGLREVSCGYEAEYTPDGKGRGIQTKIVGNHLALVDQGRAGSAYAIKDHKGKGSQMKLTDKIKAIFAKAHDEAMKAAEDEFPPKKDEDGDKEKSKDAAAYDELVKMVKDLGEKISAMGKPAKDADPKEEPKKDEPAKDADPMAALEERLKSLEAAVAKMLEMKSEESGDADPEKDKESEDDDFDETTMVGDDASRVEILAPGLTLSKEYKSDALKAAYKTKDGKKAIDSVTANKGPDFSSVEKIDGLFMSASELLKASRTKELSKMKTTDYVPVLGNTGHMSAEKINEMNAKFYNKVGV